MSNELARKLVWRLRLPTESKLVLLALADTSDRDGCSQVSPTELLGMTGLDGVAVSRALRDLDQLGYIEGSPTGNGARIQVMRGKLRGDAE